MSIANERITRGWTQGWAEDAEGRVCLIGAASRAADDDLVRYARYCEVLGIVVGCPVAAWNDAPGRTFDEVLRVAKEADELLEAGS